MPGMAEAHEKLAKALDIRVRGCWSRGEGAAGLLSLQQPSTQQGLRCAHHW